MGSCCWQWPVFIIVIHTLLSFLCVGLCFLTKSLGYPLHFSTHCTRCNSSFKRCWSDVRSCAFFIRVLTELAFLEIIARSIKDGVPIWLVWVDSEATCTREKLWPDWDLCITSLGIPTPYTTQECTTNYMTLYLYCPECLSHPNVGFLGNVLTCTIYMTLYVL